MTEVLLTDVLKVYGRTRALDGVSFDLRPGMVTGFLGPNGSGKSTTMRLILGLDRPTSGSVRVGGRAYRDVVWPLREVGAVFDAKAVHPGRTARAHLRALAASNGISGVASRKSWDWSAWPTSRTGGSGPSRWGWGSASGSRAPCWAIRGC